MSEPTTAEKSLANRLREMATQHEEAWKNQQPQFSNTGTRLRKIAASVATLEAFRLNAARALIALGEYEVGVAQLESKDV